MPFRFLAPAAAVLALFASVTPGQGQQARPATGPAASAAAASAAAVHGRWRLLLQGGAVPRLQGELRLGPNGDGTLLLETSDSAPLVLRDVRVAGGEVAFVAPLAAAPLRFTGRLGAGRRLEGQAVPGDAPAGEPPLRWSATRLAEAIEFYPATPAFTLRQIVAGRRDGELVVPGSWLGAARAGGHVPAVAVDAYAAAARAAGLTPLLGDSLARLGQTFAMGAYRRAELLDASRRTLEAIGAGLGDPRARARFDMLFRRRGAWIVDLHDAALVAARQRRPQTSWEAAAPALRAVGWLRANGADTADVDAVPLALYRLAALAERDTQGWRALRAELQRADPGAGAAAVALVEGYEVGRVWYVEALRFFAEMPWVPADTPRGRARSLGDLVREFWGDSALRAPALGTRFFGYPQAAPRAGVSAALFERLVVPENHTARLWLERHGRAGLLAVLRRLDADPPLQALADAGGETYRLTSVRRQASESVNGFLEPADVVLVDPSYVPLLALGTVVHEWQHLVFERRRHAASAPAAGPAGEVVTLAPGDPLLDEGAAEWGAEVVLAPAARRWPLVGLGELMKRARMARQAQDAGAAGETGEADGGHLTGYLLVRALADAVPERERVLRLLVEADDAGEVLLREPALGRAWARHRGTADRVVRDPSRRFVIPETRFTVEDGQPDLVGTRLRFP